ncbi:magnesium transporter [Corynebacterium sp. 320]|uniref:magnesium transporter n=1 Tax=Corynebacterium TaxID=1716 RepID=UPI00125CC3B7|nr:MULTISPECIES: magnesium transporter [Corynebacterium]KAB1503613.1 magnesium transporter [Corynebacterium sp. 320]KAB1553286.1 magnesium transporter [Corynebacterium sp. 321]KAB1553495.1 magnesium transporter [Corynebacterium sp. 319]KAB3527749.1 magnesium transporter [Corynebacterium sp. 250]KAB3540761.1 magnesium transporter [Corynebacterium sp. 366]
MTTGPDLQDLISANDLKGVKQWLTSQSSVDIAGELGFLPHRSQVVAFRLLPKDRALTVFEHLDPPHQAELLEVMRHENVEELFENLEVDDRVQVLEEMPAKVAARLLDGLDDQERKRTSALLGYPKESVGRLMTPTPTVLDRSVSREEALAKLQSHHVSMPTIAVTDNNRRLVGLVHLSTIVAANDGTIMDELLLEEKHQVNAVVDQEVAARLMQEADLLVLPIVDDEQRLLGFLTVDDAMEVLEEEATEDAYRAGGAEPLNEPYLNATVFTLAKKRGVWLIVLIFAAFLTINVMESFESTLEAIVVLSVFVPMIIGTGGNAGSQAASSVVRALAVNEVRPRDVVRVIWRELRVGLSLGAFLGLVVFPILWLLYAADVAATISLTIVFICGWACIVGGVLPLVAKKLKVDPAVFSTPVVSTLVDATGLIIYFTIANIILADQIAAAMS